MSYWDYTAAAPLLQKQIERLKRLPKSQQKLLMQMLDGMLSQAGR
ncbi:MAG: hypothetical protein ACYCUE_15535 [Steroidobacteraceae bacterium]|jgi:hypothetical protein